jgi:RNA polymerase-binding transcription factor
VSGSTACPSPRKALSAAARADEGLEPATPTLAGQGPRECLNYRATAVSLRGPPLRWPTRYDEAVDSARARQLLAAERERIERDLAGLVHPDEGAAAEADEFDAGDLGRELLQDELDEGWREDLQEQLAAVERAEQRLAAGTYGLSVRSGEPIPDERLEAVPTAELTVAEADEEARRLGR